MVRKRVLVPLIAAAALVLVVGYAFFLVPFALERQCPAAGGGPEDHGSSLAPSPGPADGGDDVACMRVPRSVSFLVGILIGCACVLFYDRFADGGEEEEEDEASGAAKKDGYVAIADDDTEPGTGAGGKN